MATTQANLQLSIATFLFVHNGTTGLDVDSPGTTVRPIRLIRRIVLTKKAPTKCRGQFAERIVRNALCDFCHVGCLGTLLTLNDLELHTIAFGEGFKTAA